MGGRSAGRFVDRRYAELGRRVREGFRAARLASLRAGDAPAVWAAFSVVGNPTAVVSLRPPAPPLRW